MLFTLLVFLRILFPCRFLEIFLF